MNSVFRKSLALGIAAFCLLALLVPAPAQNRKAALPPSGTFSLSIILMSIEKGKDEAEAMARFQAKTQPKYKSGKLESLIFEGDFIPNPPTGGVPVQLAVFSDDGVDVEVDGKLIHQRFGVGQHLPTLAQSFHVLNGSDGNGAPWIAGQKYRIRIKYSNIIFTGNADIDGITLFAMNQGQKEPPVSAGQGLIGLYYNDADPLLTWSGQAQDIRIDKKVDFTFRDANGKVDSKTPEKPVKIGGAGQKDFSVVWEGWVTPAKTGFYTFNVTAKDGERLYVNNTLLIDQFARHPLREDTANQAIKLDAGKKYPIILAYYARSEGAAVAKLSWQANSQADGKGQEVVKKEIVPEAALSHDALPNITVKQQTLKDADRAARMTENEQTVKKANEQLMKIFGLTKEQFEKAMKDPALVTAVLNKTALTGSFVDWVLFTTSFPAGSIIQQVKAQSKTTPMGGGEPTVNTREFVEGWTINAKGEASGLDTHSDLADPFRMDTTLTKSLEVQFSFKVGLGWYQGLPVTGQRTARGTKGIFDIWEPANPKDITWLGEVKEYSVIFKMNADGSWLFENTGTGLKLKGNAKKT